MNKYLKDFVKKTFAAPGTALDLGAGDGADMQGLGAMGWTCFGVDLKTGINLEYSYHSDHRPFDLVYSCFVLHKLVSPRTLVSTAFDNVRPNGFVFIQTFDASDSNSQSTLTEDSLVHLLNDVGLIDVTTRLLRHYDSDPGHQHWHIILEACGRRTEVTPVL